MRPRTSDQTTTATTTMTSSHFMRAIPPGRSTRRAAEHDLEHEARPGVAQQKQRRADVEPTGRAAAAPALSQPAPQQPREDDPREQREDRFVAPAPAGGGQRAQAHREREHDEADLDEAEGQPLQAQQR